MQPIVFDYTDWLSEQVGQIAELVAKSPIHDEQFLEFHWPLPQTDITIDNAFFIAAIVRQYIKLDLRLVSVKCRLHNFKDSFNDTKNNSLDYFFKQMHEAGHFVLKQVGELNLKGEILHAFTEMCCLFFAAMACKRYFNISNLSPFMAKEIVDLIVISNNLESSKYYDNTAIWEVVQAMFEFTLNKESYLRH